MLLAFALVTASYATSVCDVRDFGAKGDNATNDASSINRAIQDCDTVVFKDGGAFVTGSVRLKSNLTLVVQPGAEIRAAKNGEGAYDDTEENPWSAFQDFGHSYFRNSMFWGIGVANVTITGAGTSTATNSPPGRRRRATATRCSPFAPRSTCGLITCTSCAAAGSR